MSSGEPWPNLAVQVASRRESGDTVSGPGVLSWLPLVAPPTLVLVVHPFLTAWLFMWSLAFAIFLGLKWLTWCTAKDRVAHSTGRSLAYLLAWPGMDAESFLDETKRPVRSRFEQWLWACGQTVVGAALLWIVARSVSPDKPLLRGWTGMLGLILLLHFGIFQLAALFWLSRGVDAEAIMRSPIRSQSLSEFWGKRWNRGFRQCAHDLIFVPLSEHVALGFASFLVFALSGLIHDLVISLPAKAGYGLPTGYFLAQGLGVIVERSRFGRKCDLGTGLRGRVFTIMVAAGPAFCLFHPPFVRRIILPFMEAIHALWLINLSALFSIPRCGPSAPGISWSWWPVFRSLFDCTGNRICNR
jgi:Membrane bound O-acyl transferase family